MLFDKLSNYLVAVYKNYHFASINPSLKLIYFGA